MDAVFLFRIFQYIVIILSAVVHEYAHAWAADRQGDPTAKYAGRLTLNPIPHIELWGTVLIPLILLYAFGMFFGYAKPVPINPYNFNDQRKGIIWVSSAGVAANFLIAILIGLGIRFFPNFFLASIFNFVIEIGTGGQIINMWVSIVTINIWLGLFNLLPFPPLDGSKLLMALADYRAGGRFAQLISLASTPFGILIAIFIAMTFLPTLSNLILQLITGITTV